MSHDSHSSHNSHASHSSHGSHASHDSHGSHASHDSHGSHSSHASHSSHSSHVSHSSHTNSVSTSQYSDSQANSYIKPTRQSPSKGYAEAFNELVTNVNKLRSLAGASALSKSVTAGAQIKNSDLTALATSFYNIPSYKDAKVRSDAYTSHYFRKWYPISSGFFSTSSTGTTITGSGTRDSDPDSAGGYTTTTGAGTLMGSTPVNNSQGSVIGPTGAHTYPSSPSTYNQQIATLRTIYKQFNLKHTDSV